LRARGENRSRAGDGASGSDGTSFAAVWYSKSLIRPETDTQYGDQPMGTIAGLFDSWGEATQTIEALHRAGFRDEDFSVVGRADPEALAEMERESAGTGLGGVAAFGATGGGFLGGLAGLVVGLGALTVPGIGPALAAGPLSAALAGGALGIAAGGILGALVDHDFPVDDARDYQTGVDRGGILLTVNAPAARETEVGVLLRQSGLRDVSEHRRRWEDDPEYRYAREPDPVSRPLETSPQIAVEAGRTAALDR
jgi:hypothetical protein